MGLIEKVMSRGNNMDNKSITVTSKLTPEEYEFLFVLIKNSTFKGEHLELVYNLTLKLQEEYLLVKNKI